MHICKFKKLSMSLIFSCRNYSNTLCGTVVVYFGCQNILLAILVIGMFSTVWWNIFEFRFMSGGIFSTGKNGVENFLSKILVSKIFHRWLSNIFHCWWIHLSKIFCRKLYVFPKINISHNYLRSADHSEDWTGIPFPLHVYCYLAKFFEWAHHTK